MSTQTMLPFDRDAVADLSRKNQEPDWMTAIRLKGLELASELELPRVEKTRIDRWNLEQYGAYEAAGAVASFSNLPKEAQELLENEHNVVIQQNSAKIHESLAGDWKAKGVIFTDLSTALREHEELVKKYIMTAVSQDEDRISALHSALWNGGVFLYVPRNVAIDIPLQAVYISDRDNAAFAPHVLIVAEENSSVTYVDNYMSDSSQPLVHNGVAEVIVGAGARVRFASIQHLGSNLISLTRRRALVDHDGRVEWVIGEMNNGNVVSDTASILRGNGSSSDAKVICIGSESQKLSITTRAAHFGLDTPSDMITRAVMRDEASAIVNGITKIEKGATRANGQQTEKVLMLSSKARGDANPILLIDENDVKAGHAASVGQVNPEQIHYLMSRGISRKTAENLVITGFLAPVVADVPIEKVRTQLQGLIERKLMSS